MATSKCSASRSSSTRRRANCAARRPSLAPTRKRCWPRSATRPTTSRGCGRRGAPERARVRLYFAQEGPTVPDRPVERKLAAIFAADVEGYSSSMSRDEVGTVARLKSCRAVVDVLIETHRGRIFTTAGDSVMADFASAVDALHCAIAAQAALSELNAQPEAGAPMRFRIGIHVGDVIVDGANLL